MKLALIDTDILSLFFRGNPAVVTQFQAYLAEHDRIQISIVAQLRDFEQIEDILSGNLENHIRVVQEHHFLYKFNRKKRTTHRIVD